MSDLFNNLITAEDISLADQVIEVDIRLEKMRLESVRVERSKVWVIFI